MKTNYCLNLFYNTTTKLLDEMAPFKRLTKKEVSLKQRPWITTGILISMKKRDCLYKDMAKETNNHNKVILTNLYKYHRNKIVSLIRVSKKKYYSDFFEEHNTNIKKTWEGIREILNVSKKKSTNIRNIVDGESTLIDTKGITNALNKFYVNIGKSIDEKIPNAVKSFSTYLPNVNNSPILLHQCDVDEIALFLT